MTIRFVVIEAAAGSKSSEQGACQAMGFEVQGFGDPLKGTIGLLSRGFGVDTRQI